MQPWRVLLLADRQSRLTHTLLDVLGSSPSSKPVEIKLESLKFEVSSLENYLTEIIAKHCPQLIILGPTPFADTTIEDLVRGLREANATVPLIVIMEHCQPDNLLKLLDHGVSDFFTAPLRPLDVLPRIWRLLEQAQKADLLAETLKGKLGLRQLLGASRNFLAEIRKIPRIAGCDANVLIRGETGTGKELCARAIHYLSPRASKALIPVNCGATPTDLLENELFGHERGAFTGAMRSQPGLVEEANGGTLFLDEIDCLPLLAQVKLLRFIQEKEYRRLGSTKIRSADVRIISATNSIVEDSVQKGTFRQDLFFRLNIIPLTLPPLRARREDIPLLANHFLTKHAGDFKQPVKVFSPGALHSLMNHDWPGNVRELESVVLRAIALAEESVINEVDFGAVKSKETTEPDSFQTAKARVVREFERNYILRVLLASGGNITRAAAMASKNRRAFWQLIRKHEIDAQQFKPSVSIS